MSAWDAFLDRPPEGTQFTEVAHAYARREALARFAEPRFATDGTELRILPDSGQYVAVAFGQAASVNGMQGAHPDRIEYLRGIDRPVWIAFVQGGKDAVTVWSGWLSLLGEAKVIAHGTGSEKRYGWPCGERSRRGAGTALDKGRSLLFPEAIPSPPPDLFSTLERS